MTIACLFAINFKNEVKRSSPARLKLLTIYKGQGHMSKVVVLYLKSKQDLHLPKLSILVQWIYFFPAWCNLTCVVSPQSIYSDLLTFSTGDKISFHSMKSLIQFLTFEQFSFTLFLFHASINGFLFSSSSSLPSSSSITYKSFIFLAKLDSSSEGFSLYVSSSTSEIASSWTDNAEILSVLF